MGSQINITNQERITPILGMLDFNQPGTATILDAIVSPNESGTIQPGVPVILDTAATVPGVWQVKKAAYSDIPWGMCIYTVRKNSLTSYDQVKVAIPGVGGNPIIWHVAGEAITLGEYLQYNTTGAISMIAVAAGKQIAQALDPAASGALFRMALLAAPYTAA
ncbi:MAG: hypothetical protein PHS14_00280 [Elusimicrobia bacterium]|nr:hypothetical protein [Elusimicrobiota bacterium]